jgi:hypothetical protein
MEGPQCDTPLVCHVHIGDHGNDLFFFFQITPKFEDFATGLELNMSVN